MLLFFLGLMAGGFFGVAIMCLMQMARKHDNKSPKNVLKI